MVSLEEFKAMIKEKTKKVASKAKPAKEEEVKVVEEVVETKENVRDEAFYKAHKGAREDVIYG